METTNDHFAQMLMHDVIRECANLIAAVATRNGTRIALPDISEIFTGYVVEALKANGVPSRVISDMLGVSRTSLYRIESPEITARRSASSEILAVLSDSKPRSKEEILGQLSEHDPEPILSAIHHLKAIGTLTEVEGKIWCTKELGTEQGMKELILLLAAEWAPIPKADLVSAIPAEAESVTGPLESLIEAGQIEKVDDTITAVSSAVEIIATDDRKLHTGIMYAFRSMARTVTKRVSAFPEPNGRLMSWTFSDYDRDQIESLLESLSENLDGLWREKEQSGPESEDSFSINLSWG